MIDTIESEARGGQTMALDETVKRLRALLADADLYESDRADAEEVLTAADLLCRLRELAYVRAPKMMAMPRLDDALEAVEREQARERGGSDGK